MKALTILKLGGSVITDKSKLFTVDYNNLNRIVREISNVYSHDKPLILIHGGGSFGHPLAKKYGIDEGIKSKEKIFGFAETQKAMEDLNNYVVDVLQKQGLPAFPCQPSSFVVAKSGKIVDMHLHALKGLLEIGQIPVLYGVPVFDEEQGSCILSGDQIAAYIARELGAKRVIYGVRMIYGVDVDGICLEDPKINPNAKLVKEVTSKNIDEIKKYLKKLIITDITGGMIHKLEMVLEFAEPEIEYEIVNAAKPGIIERCLNGERGLGTIIKI